MPTTSITSTESFQARAQRSEMRRVMIWAFTLAGVLVLTIARRMAGGLVMSTDRVFWPTATVLAVGILVQIPLWMMLRRANRESRLLPPIIWRLSAAFDLCIPMAYLAIAGWFSPRGALTALSAPPMLLLPLVILLSVLRLRPFFTLGIGLVAAAFHMALAARAIAVLDARWDTVYFAYGVILALTAVAGMMVAQAVRGYVLEAAEEAAAHERDGQRIAAMQHDMTIARDIQAGLLPANPPSIPGFDIAGWSRPADQTGGDYYDWQTLPDGRVVMSVADASGHGIGPALVSAVCRAYARAAVQGNGDASSILQQLNQLLANDLPGDRFVTYAGVVLRPQTSEAEIFSAGHGPLLIYRAAKNTEPRGEGNWGEPLDSHGPPLSVVHDFSFDPPTRLVLEPGDFILMPTDGAFEWANAADEQFGIDRLKQIIRENAAKPAQQIIREIDSALRAFAGGTEQQDDVTIVVIKRVAV